MGKYKIAETENYSQAGLIPKSPLTRGSLWGGFVSAIVLFAGVLNPHKIHTLQNDDTPPNRRFELCGGVRHSKKIKSKKYSHLYQKIFEDVYPLLRNNPFFGGNIKKLKGEYKNIYRFRIGDYRLFYTVDEQEALILIIDIESRQDAYK